jgi:hypothetical protein
MENKKVEQLKKRGMETELREQETIPVMPTDVEAMYAGKLALMMLKMDVGAQNIIESYYKTYKEMPNEVKANLTQQKELFGKGFDEYKKKLNSILDNHPLSQRMCQIKGFTNYQLALIMAMVKDIRRFDTPSKLLVYAGCACINGMPVNKTNLKAIQGHYKTQGKEFKGFNTLLSGRVNKVVVDSLIRATGYFYQMYVRIRERIHQRCLNNKETFIAVEESLKLNKNYKIGTIYMKGKNCQSLISFTDSCARRRIASVLLHLLYTEWRTIEGLEVRNPYAIDYLKHKGLITLDDVIKGEQIIASTKPKKEYKKRVNKKRVKIDMETI